jgi:hypothetical protein
MVADFFTKPLQGASFRKMLKLIMNLSDEDIDPSPQECVGRTGESDDEQTESNPSEVEETSPPIKMNSDDSEWNVVVPKGRRSYVK